MRLCRIRIFLLLSFRLLSIFFCRLSLEYRYVIQNCNRKIKKLILFYCSNYIRIKHVGTCSAKHEESLTALNTPVYSWKWCKRYFDCIPIDISIYKVPRKIKDLGAYVLYKFSYKMISTCIRQNNYRPLKRAKKMYINSCVMLIFFQ